MTDTAASRTFSPRTFALVVAISGAEVCLDQGTKALARDTLSTNERLPLLGDLLGLKLAFNAGTVMSFGAESTWIITVVASFASIALVVIATRIRTLGWAVAVALVLGGAVGNLIDRLLAHPGFGRGHVTDFIAYGQVFIGNLADIFLGLGVGLGLFMYIRGRRAEIRQHHDDADLSAPIPKK